MRVVIVHHHLHTGGVTQVIKSQLQALEQCGIDTVLAVGELSSGFNEDHLWICPSLNYLPEGLNHAQCEAMLAELRNFFKTQLKDGDILHLHNLNLGKNPLLNLLTSEWLQQGYSIVNHCHDFAEDQRPKNMEHLKSVIEDHYKKDLESILYPQIGELKYIVINSRDRLRLHAHGVSNEDITYCPNAIQVPASNHNSVSRAKLIEAFKWSDLPIITYPVRVIERKNIGEFVLIASLLKDKAHFCVTQAPKNPSEWEHYQTWRNFCRENDIPVVFEAGDKCAFTDIMAGSDMIISTSIREGFGMAFLEPWVWGKPVIGRDLPEITQDFKQLGLRFEKLYRSFEIDCLDVSHLTPQEQRGLILETLKNLAFAQEIIRNQGLEELISPVSQEFIEQQRQIVLKHFSLETYSQNLLSLYETTV